MAVGLRRSGLLLAILAAGAFATLMALGLWQVQRLAWKQTLLATIEARTVAPPAALAEIERLAASGDDIEYRPVAVEGLFVHDAERHFFATHKGDSGWFVYTPLALDDGRAVFVNRGFAPYDRKDPATRIAGQTQGQVRIEGLARAAPDAKPSSLVPDNDPAANQFYWKDLAAMTGSAGLAAGTEVLPFFIDAGPGIADGGFPVGGVTIVDLPNNHLQYAVTWFGLAAVLAGVSVVWIVKGKDR